MIKAIQSFFETRIAGAAGGAAGADEREHAYRLATAALLVEVSRADFAVEPAERSAVAAAVRRAFGLDEAETAELIALAEAEVDEAVSLYEFTSLVDRHFDAAQKVRVIELLWQVAFADGDLDKYEEHLVRRIADLIHVRHRAYIRAREHARTRAEGQPAR